MIKTVIKNIRAILPVIIIITVQVSCFADPTALNYRKEMRNFVREISAYAKNKKLDFIIIPQNGLELVTDTGSSDGAVQTDYLAAIDGTGQEDVLYGYAGDTSATPQKITDYLRSLCDIFTMHGKKVLAIDYCADRTSVNRSYAEHERSGYISFAADERLLNTIPRYPDAPYHVNTNDISSLHDARNFLYLINGSRYASKEALLQVIINSDYDAVIMDLFQNEEPFTAQEIVRLKIKKGGGKRLVLCYMSIGEAEEYRYYWQPSWKHRKPLWLAAENPEWKGNYKVKYWSAQWKRIIYGGAGSYVDRIIAAGFDGVYLDIIDAFEYFEEK